MTGEKIKPLVIGKSRHPRCFSKINPASLPVTYRNNKKAWMTGNLYQEFLKTLNRQMKRQNRHILLFIDNAPCHPDIAVSNVKVKFFPPNTTSLTQPMDQGIIQATKLKYRKKQLLHMVKEMDRQPHACGSDLLRQISVLDAIYWLNNAWNEVDTSTIVKCFSKCGFDFTSERADEMCSPDESFDDDDVPLAAIKMTHDIFGCSFSELVDIDQNLFTCDNTTDLDWGRSAVDLIKEFSPDNVSDDSDSEENEVPVQSDVVSKSQACEMIIKIKDFAKHLGYVNMFTMISQTEDEMNAVLASNAKQTEITDFFTQRSAI